MASELYWSVSNASKTPTPKIKCLNNKALDIRSDQKFRNDIQGLRAVAVLAVIVFHYNADFLPGGYVGVDVFFVISGYLITSILLRKKDIGENLSLVLRSFYFSRINRIVPAYLVLLVIVSIAAAFLYIPDDFLYYQDSLLKSIYFSSNTYFARFGDYFAPGTEEFPLLHTWSLAIEMQFYLIVPFVLLCLPVKFLRWSVPFLIVTLTLIAEFMLRFEGKDQVTYYALYARIPEFLIGGWLALEKIGTQWSDARAGFAAIIGLFLILLSAIFVSAKYHFPGFLSILPSVGAGLVICSRNGWPSKLLSVPVLVFLGAISYSLYLWHWPVLSLLRYYTGSYQLDLSLSVLFVIATLSLSCLSYFFVEKVFTRRRSKLPGLSKLVIVGVPVTSVFLLSLVPSTINTRLLEPLPIEYRRYADLEKICHGEINGSCLRGMETTNSNTLVIGDSHAAMLNYFFDIVGEEINTNVRVITASGCVTIPEFDYSRLPKWAHDPCKKQIAHVKNFLASASTVLIAAKWSNHIESERFMKAMNDFLKNRTEEGQKILLLSQIPQFEKNPSRVRRFEYLGLPQNFKKENRFITANLLIKELAEKYNHVQYIDLTQLPLFDSAPLYDGYMVYFDGHHLNEIGSTLYGKQAVSILKKINL